MKKVMSVLISVMSLLCFAFSFAACEDEDKDDNTKKSGWLVDLVYASENGWIDNFALESIADSYYTWRNFDNNPYAGKFDSTEELSEETANIIKRAYLDNLNLKDETIENVDILKYFGTYDKSVVLTFRNGEYSEDYTAKDRTIGEIVFPDYKYKIYTFLFPDQVPETKVNGVLYSLETAFEEGLLDEKDLKSISCCCYDNYPELENPYKGHYYKPTEKLSYETKLELRKAYFEQINKFSDSPFYEIKILKFIGIYKGNIVSLITGSGCVFPDENNTKNIGK